MAKAAIGFGGSNSTGVYQSLSTLITEFAPELFQTSLSQNSPLLASGELETVECDGEDVVITLVPPAIGSVGFVRDGAKLPLGDAFEPGKARVTPCYITGVVKMGRGAAMAQLADDKLSKFFEVNTKNIANQLTRTVGRSLYGGSTSPRATAAWTNNTATGDATVTLNFEDISLFSPGMAVEYVDDSASKSYVVRVQSVTPAAFTNSANVAGTVVFINDIKGPTTGAYVAIDDSGAVTVAVTDLFRLRGAYLGAGDSDDIGTATLAGTLPNSFDDIAGSGATSSFMGYTPTTLPGWYGQTQAFTSVYAQESLLGLFARTRTLSGVAPNLAIMSPAISVNHAAAVGGHTLQPVASTALAIGGAGRLQIDNSMDKYTALANSSGITLMGQKVIVDHNLQADRVILFNTEHVKYAEWMKLGPAEEAGNPLLLGRDAFDVSYQVQGAFNLYTDLRASVAIATGFTLT